MGLKLRLQLTDTNPAGISTTGGSALTYAQGDSNFIHLLSNMSGSQVNITGSTTISGSLNVIYGITGSLSGSLFGTASYVSGAVFSNTNPAVSASYASGSTSSSYALTAAYALNGASGSGAGFPFSGSAVITGSLLVSGSGTTITVTGSIYINSGSLFGTASYVSGAVFSSTNPALSASYAATASYALSTLNSNLIFSGSVTASVDVGNTTFQLISGSTTMLFVSKSGNVGIGTTTPVTQLHLLSPLGGNAVANTINNVIRISPPNIGTLYETSYRIAFGTDALGTQDTTAAIGFMRISSSLTNYSAITFATYGGASTNADRAVERMRINPVGNVGIGTLIPGYKLDVSGSGNFSGNLTVTGSTIISSSGNQQLKVIGSGSSNPIVSVQGSQGELFSVTDIMSGSLFSVNDISGLSILEVFSDQTVLMGGYSSPSLNTTVKTTVSTGTSVLLYSLSTGSYDGIFVEYTAKSGSRDAKMGSFSTMWSGSTAITASSFVTSSTNGNGFTLSSTVTGSMLAISASVSAGTGWIVKSIIRAI